MSKWRLGMMEKVNHISLVLMLSFAFGFLAGCSGVEPKGISENDPQAPASYIDGSWTVSFLDESLTSHLIGTLNISGLSYNFQPVSRADIPEWMEEEFAFIGQPSGEVAVEYMVLQNTDLADVDDHETLAELRFNDQGETFLIRLNQDEKQLYFHSWFSEIQMYEITLDYE